MMQLEQREYRRQWAQLLTLTAAHFVLDTFTGLMHTVLPAFQESFQLSVAAGAVLLTVFLIAANGIQVIIGHVRPEKDRPFFLYMGMLLACTILLFGWAPPERMTLLWLSVISAVCGAGVGMTHPEALKAIHSLNRISSTVSSAVFMSGGIIGFAFGGWASTILFERWGFHSLIPFCIGSVVALLLMMAFRIRLAVERDEINRQNQHTNGQQVSFWVIMAIATLVASSTMILAWIVPQRFSELGAGLSKGGLAVSMFNLAGGVGGILIAKWASRRGELSTICWMLAVGIPFITTYLFFMEYSWAVALVSAGGFFCFGTYPIMVSVARHSKGPNLGLRMGLIVGGIWLAASTLPVLLGPVAKAFGTGPIIFCVPIGFVLSLALAIKTKIRNSKL
ncbi:MAG: MFS transporter [Planctomycetota bacterium]|jgi:MFS family permease